MCGIACLQPMNCPFRFTATSRSKTAMSRVTRSVSMALVEESVALLCNTSRPPNDATAFDHAHDARLVRDVDLGGNSATEFAGHALGLSPVDIGDDHQGAFARHQTCSGLADPAACACDSRDLVVKASHRSMSMSTHMSTLSGRRPAQASTRTCR